jgi:threonine/homoserine/homoserine lactone efflux protein
LSVQQGPINLQAFPVDGLSMIDLATLAVFSGAVLLLLLSPGPNMAFVISHGVTHGWRGGVASALGISAADVLLTALTATGVTALVASWPPSFDLIRYAGVVYLLWLVFKTLQKKPGMDATGVNRVPLGRVFLQAMLSSLLNPKALLFFVVFLPQFVRPQAGSIAVQLLLLGGRADLDRNGVPWGAGRVWRRAQPFLCQALKQRLVAEVGPGDGADRVGCAPGADVPPRLTNP